MRIEVVAFAQAREALGGGHVSLELPTGSQVSDALVILGREHPTLATLTPHLALAVDRQLVRGEHPLTPGCELALLPPVSGG